MLIILEMSQRSWKSIINYIKYSDFAIQNFQFLPFSRIKTQSGFHCVFILTNIKSMDKSFIVKVKFFSHRGQDSTNPPKMQFISVQAIFFLLKFGSCLCQNIGILLWIFDHGQKPYCDGVSVVNIDKLRPRCSF